MSTRIPEPDLCPCLRDECRAARRRENTRAAATAAVAVFVIIASLWAVELWRITP
jgi:hypothetical protein